MIKNVNGDVNIIIISKYIKNYACITEGSRVQTFYLIHLRVYPYILRDNIYILALILMRIKYDEITKQKITYFLRILNLFAKFAFSRIEIELNLFSLSFQYYNLENST